MTKHSLCMSMIMIVSIVHSIQGCDTLAAFAISALATHYFVSAHTAESVRVHAQTMIDDYENNRGFFTIEELHYAYKIIKYSDSKLYNHLWWEHKISAVFVGFFTAALYHALRYPSKKGNRISTDLYFSPPRSHNWAAPRFRLT